VADYVERVLWEVAMSYGLSQRHLSLYALILAVLVPIGGAHRLADDTVTGIGSFFCYDGSTGATVPLAGARVELWDSDCDGSTICDDFMGSSYIQSDGHFSVTGHGGDPLGGAPDPYIRVMFNDDQGVRLTDELDNDRYADTPEHDHNDVSGGTVDFGAWTTGLNVGTGNASKCGVWVAARAAYQEYVALMGGPPPAGHWDVEYWSGVYSGTPWTNDNTTHWPIHYSTYAAKHEFGHSIRHAADGDRNHFNWDVTRFRYARNHNICDPSSNRIGTDTHQMGLAFGFNEGWAEYWNRDVTGCWAVTIDDESEGNNAYALNVLAGEPGVGKQGMVEVLKAHPGQIHSLDEFIQFLVARTSMTTSALSAAVNQARAPDSTLLKRVVYPTIPDGAQRAIVQGEATEVAASIESERLQLSAVRDSSRHLPPCLHENCSLAIRAALRVPMLEATLSAHQLYLDRLRQYLASDFPQRFRHLLATGKLDGFLRHLRLDQERRLRQIYARAFEEAQRALKRLASQSPAARAEALDLARKYASLRSTAEGKGGVRIAGVAAQMPLREDLPTPRPSLPQQH